MQLSSGVSTQRRSRPSSIFSFYSGSSTSKNSSSRITGSTVPGIGAIAGRAVKAFGEAGTRLLDNVNLRRRLSSINARFPHDDSVIDGEMDEIYAILVEVLTDLDDDFKWAKNSAMAILVKQVQHGETKYLLNYLSSLSIQEVLDFVSQIMSRFTCSQDITFIDLAHGWRIPANNALRFLCELAGLFDTIFPLLLEKGFLDMVIYVCVGEKNQTTPHNFLNCLTVCNSTLSHHSQDPHIKDRISQHALSDLWPSYIPFFLRNQETKARKPNLDRCRAWKKLKADTRMIEYRIATVARLVSKYCAAAPGSAPRSSSQLSDMILDTLEFSRKSIYGNNIAEASSALLQELIEGPPKIREVYDICRRAVELGGDSSLAESLAVINSKPGPTGSLPEDYLISRPGYETWSRFFSREPYPPASDLLIVTDLYTIG